MTDVNTLIEQRLKKGNKSSKMAAMAEQSANGKLSSFAGLFSISELNIYEKAHLETILKQYAQGNENLAEDLDALVAITAEVKAINNQAAILHGERIKKAHSLLAPYRDGAFSSWLIAAYGNRQTPYNFMQYFLFYDSLPFKLRPQLENMPKQAVYTLATREGDLKIKQKLVEDYNGETKNELLIKIREVFPLDDEDKRKQNSGDQVIQSLRHALISLRHGNKTFSKAQKFTIQDLIEQLKTLTKDVL